jgi:Uma2 family endonuclease
MVPPDRDDTHYLADIVFDRRRKRDGERYFVEAPLFVAEVLDPARVEVDLAGKLPDYRTIP